MKIEDNTRYEQISCLDRSMQLSRGEIHILLKYNIFFSVLGKSKVGNRIISQRRRFHSLSFIQSHNSFS